MKKVAFVVFALTLILLMIPACNLKPSKTYWPGTNFGTRSQPVHILVDEDFSTVEQSDIHAAMRAWEVASSGKVKFIPTWGVNKPGQFKYNRFLIFDQGIFFWHLPKNSVHFTETQLIDVKPLGGLTLFGPGSNSAHVIVFSDVPQRIFYAVSLHELGHLIGLNHIKANAVMHENVKAACITPLDAQQLCELYECVPKPDCKS